MAIASGLYELRSVLLTSMCVDVAGGSAVKGANVQLYAANDSNAQKYYLVEETSGHWSIQNAASQLYVDVAGGAAANGANVQQWSANGSRAQRWKVTETGGTVTVDGVSCPVVTLGSYVTDDGATWMADVDHAMTSNQTNIQLHSANGTPAQQFALLPTTLQDAQMPAPSIIGWAAQVGSAGAQAVQRRAARLYPAWSFTDAWAGMASHGFEISYRSRHLANDAATETDWSGWAAWQAASCTLYGQTAWLTAGLDAGFDTESYKAMEYQVRVRSTSVVGGVTLHSRPTTAVLRAVCVPSVSVTAARRVPDAMRLTVSTDYEGGVTSVRVTDVRASGGANVLAKPVMGRGTGPTFDVDVPLSCLSQALATGAITIGCEVGTDLYPATGYTSTSSVTYSDASGRTLTVATALTWGSDGTATIVANVGGSGTYEVTAWLDACGEVVELTEPSPGTFALPYPFGVACTWIVFARSTTGSAWGMATGTIAADDTRKIKACHAWNWDGGALLLEVDEAPLQTSRTLKADFTNYQLSGREWHALKFSDTLGGEFSATGVLVGGITLGSTEALMQLLRAHHATYRAPSGEVAHVGITEVHYTTACGVTRVTVSMTQVTP